MQEFSGFPSLILRPTERIFSSVGLRMFLVESKGGAIGCMVLALLFLGTWPAIMTLLERRGRLPQHTYLDYTMTNLLAAVIIALTFGEFGNSTPEFPNFIPQLSQVSYLYNSSVLNSSFSLNAEPIYHYLHRLWSMS